MHSIIIYLFIAYLFNLSTYLFFFSFRATSVIGKQILYHLNKLFTVIDGATVMQKAIYYYLNVQFDKVWPYLPHL